MKSALNNSCILENDYFFEFSGCCEFRYIPMSGKNVEEALKKVYSKYPELKEYDLDDVKKI